MAKRARRHGLRGQMWFYKHCVLERHVNGPASALSWDLLLKGVAQQDHARGHVGQAIGAVQEFFKDYPRHRETIATTGPNEPYNIMEDETMLRDWRDWLARKVQRHQRPDPPRKRGDFGRAAFGYNINTMRTYLPERAGGRRRTRPGGVGLDEFKKVLRLVAEFWDRNDD